MKQRVNPVLSTVEGSYNHFRRAVLALTPCIRFTFI